MLKLVICLLGVVLMTLGDEDYDPRLDSPQPIRLPKYFPTYATQTGGWAERKIDELSDDKSDSSKPFLPVAEERRLLQNQYFLSPSRQYEYPTESARHDHHPRRTFNEPELPDSAGHFIKPPVGNPYIPSYPRHDDGKCSLHPFGHTPDGYDFPEDKDDYDIPAWPGFEQRDRVRHQYGHPPSSPRFPDHPLGPNARLQLPHFRTPHSLQNLKSSYFTKRRRPQRCVRDYRKCDANYDCCSNLCYTGQCIPSNCKKDGELCIGNDQCCSQFCSWARCTYKRPSKSRF